MTYRTPRKAPGDAERQRLENLLGAFTLTVADDMQQAATDAAGLSVTACAALTVLDTSPGISVDGLAKIIDLQHSSTVRLVASLERADLLTRGRGADGRSLSLTITDAGRATVVSILSARAQVLSSVVDDLDADQQTALAPVLEQVLAARSTSELASHHICRLCDIDSCPQQRCPAAYPPAAS